METILPYTYAGRLLLITNANKLKEKLKTINVQTSGNSQIIPIILNEKQKAIELSQTLSDCGYFVPYINYLSSINNSTILRLSLTSSINIEELDEFFEIFSHLN